MGTGKFEIALELGIVVYVEMALKWSDTSGVHSLSTAGQFVLFFIALAQLFTTLYRLGNTYSLSRRKTIMVGKVSFFSLLFC
jgi:hypothetical protein